MTDREKAIVMAYTGISMLEGDKLNVFYQYLTELYGRPVYTHELIALDIEHKSKPDFLKLCDEEDQERKTGKWIERNPQNSDKCRLIECDQCGFAHIVGFNVPYEDWIENRNFCERCGADMRGEGEQE